MRSPYLGLAVLVSVLVGAPAAAVAEDLESLDRIVNARLATSQTPGLAVAFVRQNGSVVERTYGVRSVETRDPVLPGTLFRNASAAKMWTAAALLVAMEERKLSIHQPIGSLVQGLRPELARLTVHQLLSHTAGLADAASESGSLDESALAASFDDPRAFAVFTEPGRIMSYSNPGYQIAGYVLETLTGERFADAVARLVLKPIGADRTFFRPMTAMTYPLALGHVGVGEGAPRVVRPMSFGYREAPSGGASFTTAADSARFAALLLRGGRSAEGKQILSPSVAAAMTTPHAPLSEAAGAVSYGYGLWIRTENGEPRWDHGGGIEGYNTSVNILPRQGVAVVVMANASAGALVDQVNADVVKQLRAPSPGGPAQAEAEAATPRASKSKAKAIPRQRLPAPDELASALIGRWGQGDYVFTVRRNGKNLEYLVGETNLGTLYYEGGDRLPLVSPNGQPGGYVAVVRDAAGRPAYLAWGGRASSRLSGPPAR